MNLWYLKGILERSEASASFAKLVWISKEQRQSSKLLKPRSFDACKNTAVLMIVMLNYLELDTEVSDVGIETIESNDCRGMSRSDGDANGILTTMWEGAIFSYKDKQKFIDLFIQSISGLCQAS